MSQITGQSIGRVPPSIIAQALGAADPCENTPGARTQQHREACGRIASALADVLPGFDQTAFLAEAGAL